MRQTPEGWLVPVKSVGVQGDERSYAPVMAIDSADGSLDYGRAIEIVNQVRDVNRVVALIETRVPVERMQVWASELSAGRIARLRRADAAVRALSHQSGYDREVWQFPVILIPLGTAEAPDSIVLRPIDSVDGMTARSVPMDAALRSAVCAAVLEDPAIAGVFYDLTHKPPGTIEWE